MKRDHLLIHLEHHGCRFLQLTNDLAHYIMENEDNGERVPVPKNIEVIKPELCAMICISLKVEIPKDILEKCKEVGIDWEAIIKEYNIL